MGHKEESGTSACRCVRFTASFRKPCSMFMASTHSGCLGFTKMVSLAKQPASAHGTTLEVLEGIALPTKSMLMRSIACSSCRRAEACRMCNQVLKANQAPEEA